MPEDNVLVMHFPAPSNAFQALSQIKGQPGLGGAAVVERTSEGQIRVADGYSSTLGSGTVVGGLVGGLVGVLAGPLGVLLGWSTGALAGAMVDSDEALDTDDGLTILSQSIPAGGNALIAEMSETSNAVADDVAAKLGGTVTRIPAADVQAEIAAAQNAERAAAAEARRARQSERRADFKEKLSGLRLVRGVKGAFERVEQRQEAQQLESEDHWRHENLGATHLDKMGDRIASDSSEPGDRN